MKMGRFRMEASSVCVVGTVVYAVWRGDVHSGE